MHKGIIELFININSFVSDYTKDTDIKEVVTFRDKIISQTKTVHDLIYQEHGERASFYVAFSIYAYCDEMINHKTLNSLGPISNWHLLQEEVYQRNDGGDYFFEIVDSVLENPVFPKVVAQVLYMILSLGFKGCHLGIESEIDKYRNKLSIILPEHDLKMLDIPSFDVSKSKFKKTYKSRLLKSLLVTSLCFPVLAYLGIYFVR